MRIKQMNVNDKKLYFGKSNNLILIKEKDIFDNIFLDSVKTVFCDTNINIDCVCMNKLKIKCFLETLETDFIITIKANERLLKNKNVFGSKGKFEVSCKANFNNKNPDNNRIRRLCKCDFREYFMPIQTTREIAFYDRNQLDYVYYTHDYDYTNGLINYYRGLKKWITNNKNKTINNYNIITGQDDFYATTESQCGAIERFIDEFIAIDLGFCSVGFDKNKREFILPHSNNSKENRIINFCDFITANKLNTVLETYKCNDGYTPVFLFNAFYNIDKNEIEFYIKQLQSLQRQVFIIEGEDNAFLEDHCDLIIDF